jgi:5-methylcytosine-specific restriction endonuclease McrA
LAIIATDHTFKKKLISYNKEIWIGKCIFCNKKLCINLQGIPDDNVTIEHIIPKSKGGTNDLENLALACSRCNNEKGIRHDINKANKQRAFEVIEKLKEKRMKRWRKEYNE